MPSPPLMAAISQYVSTVGWVTNTLRKSVSDILERSCVRPLQTFLPTLKASSPNAARKLQFPSVLPDPVLRFVEVELRRPRPSPPDRAEVVPRGRGFLLPRPVGFGAPPHAQQHLRQVVLNEKILQEPGDTHAAVHGRRVPENGLAVAVWEELPGTERIRNVVFPRFIQYPTHRPVRGVENQIKRVADHAERNANRLGDFHGVFRLFQDLNLLEPRHKFVELMIVQHHRPHGGRRLVDEAVGDGSGGALVIPGGVGLGLDHHFALFHPRELAHRESGGRSLTRPYRGCPKQEHRCGKHEGVQLGPAWHAREPPVWRVVLATDSSMLPRGTSNFIEPFPSGTHGFAWAAPSERALVEPVSLVAISAPELDPANHRQVIFDDPGRLDARDATSQHRPKALLEHDGIDAPQPPLLLDPEREQPERTNSSSGEKELQPAQGKQAPSRGGDGLVEVAQGHEEADRLARAVRVADFRQ